MRKAVDISNNNGSVNMQYLVNAGYELAIFRATEGTSGTGSRDQYYHTNIANAKKAGLLTGAYHFAHFKNLKKCQTEIENFKSFIAGTNPDVVALDMEEQLGNMNITDLSLYFMDAISSIAPTIFYANSSLLKTNTDKRITKYDLWVANYGVSNPGIYPYSKYALWQYTESGRLAGINSNLDLNYMTDEFFNKIKGKNYTAPKASTLSFTTTQASSATIKSIQSTLNSKYGTKIGADDIYGQETRTALIKALQTELNTQFKKGLAVDGIIGTATLNALQGFVVKQGAKGQLTWIIQALFKCRGWSLDVDGIYGADTYNTVIAFQKEKKLSIDGIVGKATIVALFNEPY